MYHQLFKAYDIPEDIIDTAMIHITVKRFN